MFVKYASFATALFGKPLFQAKNHRGCGGFLILMILRQQL